jgi:hypothetical protein
MPGMSGKKMSAGKKKVAASRKKVSKPVMLGMAEKKAAKVRKQERMRAKNKTRAARATTTHGNANTPGFAYGRKTI